MKRALLVIDVQRGLVEAGSFGKELSMIAEMIRTYKQREEPVFFLRHVYRGEGSIFSADSRTADLHESVEKEADMVLEKERPSAFLDTNLHEELQKQGVEEIVITGFNAEFCCMFTAVAGVEYGYQVTYMEDAVASVHSPERYGAEGGSTGSIIARIMEASSTVRVEKGVGRTPSAQ
ncbi:cysteine hydrolase family protein [Alkalicoccus chagannorensis]|uniref:cysteine hydrolase family protein n=1 Tax=Alkalicoccus chagannorensis TaxID=427072 RepID=UPI00068557C3|nr:isochorismatase family cysteine hydrolase [Alkalicoccus chagannorensis]